MSQSISISRRQFILGAGALGILGTTYATYNQIGGYPQKPEDILFFYLIKSMLSTNRLEIF